MREKIQNALDVVGVALIVGVVVAVLAWLGFIAVEPTPEPKLRHIRDVPELGISIYQYDVTEEYVVVDYGD